MSALVATAPKLQVLKFYEGKKVLLTGCTGFIGKVMLEKFLRSVPKIGTIYLLVREKRNKSKNARVQEILQSQCFDRVKALMGEETFNSFATEKIVPVIGDLIIEGLGMSKEDRQMLVENCQCIINCAASVSFNEPL